MDSDAATNSPSYEYEVFATLTALQGGATDLIFAAGSQPVKPNHGVAFSA